METKTNEPKELEIEALGARVTPTGILISVYAVNGQKKCFYPTGAQFFQAKDGQIGFVLASTASPQEN